LKESGVPQVAETTTRQDVGVNSAGKDRGRPSDDYSGRPAAVDLAGVLGRIARELEAEQTFETTMRALVAAAVDAIPGADAGGITEVRRRGQELQVQFATDPLVTALDNAQYELGEGPCLDAAYEHRTVRVSDFATDDRWHSFAARACTAGALSMLSIQLYVLGDDLGALNMYSTQVNGFDDESEEVGLLFATHAAIAMAGAQREQQLRVAISSRDIIGQAKGILMERHKLTADQAFAVLTKASSQTNRKLRDVAEVLAGTGEEPAAR
jgi:GAF domain-containing protein